MTTGLFIPGPLPSMNDIIDAAKSGRGRGNAYARLKKQWTETVWAQARSKMQPVTGQVSVHFDWREKDSRRDIDNVAAGAKFVLDGLVMAGIIQSDSQRHVHSLEHTFNVDPDRPGVFVRVELAEPPF